MFQSLRELQHPFVASLESWVLEMRFKIDRYTKLEYMENPHSLEGKARCDY